MAAPLGPRRSSGLMDFNPPRDAEPSATAEVPNGDQNGDGAKPTVLSKLQKWADYPSVGNPVNPTNFLPMKTPMSLEIISNWSLEQPPKHSLTVPELLRSQDIAGRCVGMIIDLANHECLYAEDLPNSLEYTHIQLVAKVLPPPEAINAVAAAAAEFWARRPHDYIAIHCAYGFNRTGFVVCSYLCQECGMTVPEALESFAQARPPGVKHGKFVDELYSRYGTSNLNNGTNNSTINSTNSTTTAVDGLNCTDGRVGNISREEKTDGGAIGEEPSTERSINILNTSTSAAAAAAASKSNARVVYCERVPLEGEEGTLAGGIPLASPPPPAPPPASPSAAGNNISSRGGGTGTGTPRSGLLSMHLRRGSGASVSGASSTNGGSQVGGGSFSRREDDDGSLDGQGTVSGYGAWKEERANSISASDEGYPSSTTSLSLLGASVGSPSASTSAAAAVRGSLFLSGNGGSRTTSSRSLLAVAEHREDEKGRNDTIHTSNVGEEAIITSENLLSSNGGGDGGGGRDQIQGGSSNAGIGLVEDDGTEIEPRTSGQWSEMASHLDGKSLMRRETSLGLAKALHEDFGVHDSTPSRLIPSPLMKKLGAEEAAKRDAEEERGDLEVENQVRMLELLDDNDDIKNECFDVVDNGDSDCDGGGGHCTDSAFADTPLEHQTAKLEDQIHRPLPLNNHHTQQQQQQGQQNAINFGEMPSSTPPSATSMHHQQPWTSSPGLPLNNHSMATAPSGVGAAAATPMGALSGGPSSGGAGAGGWTTTSNNNILLPGAASADLYMTRNMSFESDCHSLGFNAREAITQLRSQQSGAGNVGNVGASFNRQYSVASDLDTTLWETSEDETGGNGGGGSGKVKAKVQSRQQEQRRDCSVM